MKEAHERVAQSVERIEATMAKWGGIYVAICSMCAVVGVFHERILKVLGW